MSFKNNNEDLIYNVLMTKINEYIDTIILNKELETALKNTQGPDESIKESLALKEIFMKEKQIFDEQDVLTKYKDKNPESLYRKIQDVNLLKIFQKNGYESLSESGSPIYQKMPSDKKTRLDSLIRNKFVLERKTKILTLLRIQDFKLEDFLDDLSFINKIEKENSGKIIDKKNLKEYEKDNEYLISYFKSILRFLHLEDTKSLKEGNIFFTNKFKNLIKNILGVLSFSQDKSLQMRFNILEFTMFIFLISILPKTDEEQADQDISERQVPSYFDFSSTYVGDEINLKSFIKDSFEKGKDLVKTEINRPSNTKLNNFLYVITSEESVNIFLNSIDKKKFSFYINADFKDVDKINENINATLSNINEIYNLVKPNMSIGYFNNAKVLQDIYKDSVSETDKGIKKILDFEIKKDKAKDVIFEKIFSGEITSGVSRIKILNDLGINKDKITYYVIQDLLQSITKRPRTTPQLLKEFGESSTIINNFIINSQNLSINKKNGQNESFKHEDVGIKILYASGPETNILGEIFSSKKHFRIQKENITTHKKFAPRSGDIYLPANKNGFLAQRYGIMAQAETQNPEYYSLNEILFDKSEPSHLGKTNFSYIMINNPLLRISSRNELELSVFMNLLSTIELSKCNPYLDMRLELPSILNVNNETLSINTVPNYLYGTPIDESDNVSIESEVSDIFNVLKSENSSKRVPSTETNMSIFSMPQTLNNFDESNFERQGKNKSTKFSRFNNVYDTTRPFLTLKSFTIDVAPTQGLMSFKTGKVSLVLHDKSRMNDVAPFIKPDLFGVHGSEIVVTYGWNNIENNLNKNLLGAFLNNQKVTEKYIITNSSFNVTKNGEVNIDLSVAMRGPVDLKSIVIEKDTSVKLEFKPLETAYLGIKELHGIIENTRMSNGVQQSDFIIEIDYFDSIYNFCKSLTPSNYKEKNTAQKAKGTQTNITVDDYKITFDKYRNDTSKKVTPRNVIKNLAKVFVEGKDSTNKLSNELARAVGEAIVTIINYIIKDSTITGTIKFEAGIIQTKEATFYNRINTLLNLYTNFIDAAENYIKTIENYNKKSSEFIKSIIAGLDKVDPFYDRKLSEEIYGLFKNNKEKNIGLSLDKTTLPGSEYVTLGTFITGIIGTQLAALTVYDDIQIVSYCANNSSGLMSGKNISSLLIERKRIDEILKDYYSDPEGSLTLEGFFSQVLETINTNSNASYGMSTLYKVNDSGVVSPLSDDVKTQEKSINDRLKLIYTKIIGNRTEDDAIFPFKRPKIRMSFDTMLGGDLNEKTILRISIYDDNDNPFEAISELFIKDKNNELLKQGALLGRYKASENQVVYNKKSKEIIDKLKAPKEKNGLGLINIGSKGEVTFTDEGRKLIPVKNEIKRNIPSVTYGTQNSGIVEASVTTVNESKLNTVYLTRNNQNNSDNLKRLQSSARLPLSVLPAQASVTMFGCPFINFAQFMFLDFETGTTLDNIYAVTGIKHDLSPGRFMTTLSMSYGDVYGKYRNALDLIENAATPTNVETPTPAQSQTQQQTIATQKTSQLPVLKTKTLNHNVIFNFNNPDNKDAAAAYLQLSTSDRIKKILIQNANLNANASLEKINEEIKLSGIQFYVYAYYGVKNQDSIFTYVEEVKEVKSIGILYKLESFSQPIPITSKLPMKKVFKVSGNTSKVYQTKFNEANQKINNVLKALGIDISIIVANKSPEIETETHFQLIFNKPNTENRAKVTISPISTSSGDADLKTSFVDVVYKEIVKRINNVKKDPKTGYVDEKVIGGVKKSVSIGRNYIVAVKGPSAKRKPIKFKEIKNALNSIIEPNKASPAQNISPITSSETAQIKQSTPLPEPVGQVVDFKVSQGDTELRWLLIYDSSKSSTVPVIEKLITELRRLGSSQPHIAVSVLASGDDIIVSESTSEFSDKLSARGAAEWMDQPTDHMAVMETITEKNVIMQYNVNAILYLTGDVIRSRPRKFEIIDGSTFTTMKNHLDKIIVKRIFNISSNGSCPTSYAPSTFDTNKSWPQACISIDNIGNIFRNLPTKA